MEFDFVKSHGLIIEGYHSTNSENEYFDLKIKDGYVTVCSIHFEGSIEDFQNCETNEDCYN